VRLLRVKGGGDEQRDIRRNIERFPGDFMYQLTRQEVKDLRLQNATSKKGGRRYLPYVFTQEGVGVINGFPAGAIKVIKNGGINDGE
jgi:hypothetical protein